MRDFSDRVGAPRAPHRFPFPLMTEIGDMFTAPEVPHRSMAAHVSLYWNNTDGRRFATFRASSGGVRVFLVDIVEKKKSLTA